MKIKIINISIIIITILCSLYFVITRDNNIVLVLKDLSIILTINLLYIIEKIFKIKLSNELNLIYILFIFMSHFLGVICELYNSIYWFDKLVHFLSGMVSSFAAIYILVKFNKNKNVLFNIIFIISFAMMVASLWEIFEYLSSYYLGVDPQKVVLTGVTDTMGDIIVAFLGSNIISLFYYYEYKENHNLLIRKYVKKL